MIVVASEAATGMWRAVVRDGRLQAIDKREIISEAHGIVLARLDDFDYMISMRWSEPVDERGARPFISYATTFDGRWVSSRVERGTLTIDNGTVNVQMPRYWQNADGTMELAYR